MKTIINLIMILLISLASVMAYGGGGSSSTYFKIETDKKTGTKLTHFDTKKKENIEYSQNKYFKFKLNAKNLKYVDVYETKTKMIVFRTSESRTVLVEDIYGNTINVETNQEYDLEQIYSELSVKESQKNMISFMKGTKKVLFGLESKGTYLVSTPYGITQVSIFE